MLLFARAALALGMATLCLTPAAQAQSEPQNQDQNVFVMGGPFTTGYFGDAFFFWDDHYESNFFAGVGYQHFFHHYESFKLGVEAGIGLRQGTQTSAELWGGLVAGLTEFSFGDITITPSITAGLSVVTDTIGVETDRADKLGRDVPILYYLAPEIAISHAAHPEWETFARIQHRSGGFGTIANIDGSNAAVIGLRFKF